MAVSLKFGAYVLDDLVEEWQEDGQSRVSVELIPRRHGGIDEPGVLAPKVIALRGRVVSTISQADLRSKLNALTNALNAGKQKLFLFDDRYLDCQKRGLSWQYEEGTGLFMARFTVDLIASDPFVKDVTLTSISQLITATPQTFSVTNSGDAPTKPLIKIVADQGVNVVNPKLTNQTASKFFQYLGTITAGNQLVVDAAALTVVANGSPDLANLDGEFWDLLGGANSLKYDGAVCTIRVDYRNQWWA